MAGYRFDTFQQTSLIHFRQTVDRCAVAKQACATSFFISCAKCLWGVVGYFLGPLSQPESPGFTGLSGGLALAGTVALSSHVK